LSAITVCFMSEYFVVLSAEPVGSRRYFFTAVFQRDPANWAMVARQANVKAD
jgi:hypothetical protein